MRKVFILFVITVLAVACSSKQQVAESISTKGEVEELYTLMTGKFSSAVQAKNDSDYYEISLIMYPIWEKDADIKWLYVEQAVASMADKPYRQRVYRVSALGNGKFESKVYELPKPEDFVFSWKDGKAFEQLSESDLIERQGCAIILEKNAEGCFEGSTNKDDCKSDFRGAAYASSIVSVCSDQLVSWDQGWNDNDEQVWGAVKGGYQFDKLEGFK